MKKTALARGTKGLSRGSGLSRPKPVTRSDAAGATDWPRNSEVKKASGLSRKPLNPVSASRKADNADDGAWTLLKALVDERDGGVCQVAAVWTEFTCQGPTTHHHVEPTGQGYERICDASLLLTVCWAHHSGPGGLHAETRLARQRGVLR